MSRKAVKCPKQPASASDFELPHILPRLEITTSLAVDLLILSEALRPEPFGRSLFRLHSKLPTRAYLSRCEAVGSGEHFAEED